MKTNKQNEAISIVRQRSTSHRTNHNGKNAKITIKDFLSYSPGISSTKSLFLQISWSSS